MSLPRGQSLCQKTDSDDEPGAGAAEGVYNCFKGWLSQEPAAGLKQKDQHRNVTHSVDGWAIGTGSEVVGS